jgi:hypothetical protein
MAFDDYFDIDYDEIYDFGKALSPKTKLIDNQDDPTKWKSNGYGYLFPHEIKDNHLLNCIHLCERKVLNEYDKFPTIYYRLIAEAVKRKIIPVVRTKRIIRTKGKSKK